MSDFGTYAVPDQNEPLFTLFVSRVRLTTLTHVGEAPKGALPQTSGVCDTGLKSETPPMFTRK